MYWNDTMHLNIHSSTIYNSHVMETIAHQQMIGLRSQICQNLFQAENW